VRPELQIGNVQLKKNSESRALLGPWIGLRTSGCCCSSQHRPGPRNPGGVGPAVLRGGATTSAGPSNSEMKQRHSARQAHDPRRKKQAGRQPHGKALMRGRGPSVAIGLAIKPLPTVSGRTGLRRPSDAQGQQSAGPERSDRECVGERWRPAPRLPCRCQRSRSP
jgi:hypothetical protein